VLDLGQAIAGALSSEGDIQLVYLFGSYARGTASGSSDVDVAVLAAAPLEVMRLAALQERLSTALALPVDLVDLRHVAPLLAWEIVRDGIPLRVVDAAAKLDFELDALRRWEDTRTLRRQQHELLRERARRGRTA
jgi:predicted nucleotidyltransferase